jgi:hypothetical protein
MDLPPVPPARPTRHARAARDQVLEQQRIELRADMETLVATKMQRLRLDMDVHAAHRELEVGQIGAFSVLTQAMLSLAAVWLLAQTDHLPPDVRADVRDPVLLIMVLIVFHLVAVTTPHIVRLIDASDRITKQE